MSRNVAGFPQSIRDRSFAWFPGLERVTVGRPPLIGWDRKIFNGALAKQREEAGRLQALEAAADKCLGERRQAEADLDEAKEARRAALDVAPADRAWAYVQDRPLLDFAVATAKIEVEDLERRVRHLAETEVGLGGEIRASQARLDNANLGVSTAMASLLISSPQYQNLLADLDAAWAKVRGIRKALLAIGTACAGQMPQAELSKWQESIPADPEIHRGPKGMGDDYPLDESIAENWRQAVAALLAGDPNASLPGDQ